MADICWVRREMLVMITFMQAALYFLTFDSSYFSVSNKVDKSCRNLTFVSYVCTYIRK